MRVYVCGKWEGNVSARVCMCVAGGREARACVCMRMATGRETYVCACVCVCVRVCQVGGGDVHLYVKRDSRQACLLVYVCVAAGRAT